MYIDLIISKLILYASLLYIIIIPKQYSVTIYSLYTVEGGG